MSEPIFVRLKPRGAKRRKGIPLTPERYMYRGQRFEASKGWYTITDEDLANDLSKLTHNDREDGVLIFDVCTKEQARQLEAREKAVSETRSVDAAERVGRGSRVTRDRAVKVEDVKPRKVEQPPMIDGAEDEDDLVDGDDIDDTGSEIGKIVDGNITQEVDDDDDLLEGKREPRETKVTVTEESPKPRTKAAAKPAKAAAKPKAGKE